MAAEGVVKTIKIEAGTSKLDETVQELDHAVDNYRTLTHDYAERPVENSEVEETVQSVIESFESVFEDQEWLGQKTAEMIDEDTTCRYDKFLVYQGLVRAASRIQEEDQNANDRKKPSIDTDNLRECADEIIETWNRFIDSYSTAVNAESGLRQISLQEGSKEEGIDPYAFDTAFMELEPEYKRISDLNRFIENSYR